MRSIPLALGRHAGWLLLAAGAFCAGMFTMLDFGYSLPDKSGGLIGAILGSVLAVLGALVATNYNHAKAEQLAGTVRRSKARAIACLIYGDLDRLLRRAKDLDRQFVVEQDFCRWAEVCAIGKNHRMEITDAIRTGMSNIDVFEPSEVRVVSTAIADGARLGSFLENLDAGWPPGKFRRITEDVDSQIDAVLWELRGTTTMLEFALEALSRYGAGPNPYT